MTARWGLPSQGRVQHKHVGQHGRTPPTLGTRAYIDSAVEILSWACTSGKASRALLILYGLHSRFVKRAETLYESLLKNAFFILLSDHLPYPSTNLNSDLDVTTKQRKKNTIKQNKSEITKSDQLRYRKRKNEKKLEEICRDSQMTYFRETGPTHNHSWLRERIIFMSQLIPRGQRTAYTLLTYIYDTRVLFKLDKRKWKKITKLKQRQLLVLRSWKYPRELKIFTAASTIGPSGASFVYVRQFKHRNIRSATLIRANTVNWKRGGE